MSLFHVRGTSAANTRSVQVEESAKMLNSGDAFILLTPGKMWVWYGKGASEDERRTAKATAHNMLQVRCSSIDALGFMASVESMAFHSESPSSVLQTLEE